MLEKKFIQAESAQAHKSLKEKLFSAVESAAKTALILTMLMGSAKQVEALEKDSDGPDQTKNKIELAQESLKQIKIELAKINFNETRTLNGREIKTIKLTSGQELVASEDGTYVILMVNNGERSFYDENGDGAVDRMIINKTNDRNLVNNGLYIFQEAERLAAEAEIVGSVKPEPVQIVILNQDKTASFIDMSGGQSGIISGQSAVELSDKMQAAYANQLESISSDLKK